MDQLKLKLNPRYIEPINIGEVYDKKIYIFILNEEYFEQEMIELVDGGVNFKNVVINQWTIEFVNVLLAIKKFKRLDFTHCVIGQDTFNQLHDSLNHIETLHLYDNIITGDEMRTLFEILAQLYILSAEEYNLPLKNLILAQVALPENLNFEIFNNIQNLELAYTPRKTLEMIFKTLEYNRSIERLIIKKTSFDESVVKQLVSLINHNTSINEYVFGIIKMDQMFAGPITEALGANTWIHRLRISFFIDDILPVLSIPPHLKLLIYKTKKIMGGEYLSKIFDRIRDYHGMQHLEFVTEDIVSEQRILDKITGAFAKNKSIASFVWDEKMLPAPIMGTINLFIAVNQYVPFFLIISTMSHFSIASRLLKTDIVLNNHRSIGTNMKKSLLQTCWMSR